MYQLFTGSCLCNLNIVHFYIQFEPVILRVWHLPLTVLFETCPMILWKDIITILYNYLYVIYTVHRPLILPILHLDLLNIGSKISRRWTNTLLLEPICTIKIIYILLWIMFQMKIVVNIYKCVFVILITQKIQIPFKPYIWFQLCRPIHQGIKFLR